MNCSLPECGKALKPPILQCSKCHAVAYCSRACQVKAWKAGHKRECSAAAADEHVNVARLPEITHRRLTGIVLFPRDQRDVPETV